MNGRAGGTHDRRYLLHSYLTDSADQEMLAVLVMGVNPKNSDNGVSRDRIQTIRGKSGIKRYQIQWNLANLLRGGRWHAL